jgi:hypothetical protein
MDLGKEETGNRECRTELGVPGLKYDRKRVSLVQKTTLDTPKG